VLLGSAATTAEGRRRFIAQTAASEWDIVVILISAFTKIGVNNAARTEYIQEQLDGLRQQLAKAESDRTVKEIERAIKTATERIERLTSQAGKDAGLGFENTGCDYLFVDFTDRN
jgi:hypothetical protein